MGFDISGGHTIGVYEQDLLLNVPGDAGLVLFQYLWLKFHRPFSRNRRIYIAKAGAPCFAVVTVTDFVCVFVSLVVLAVARFVICLRLRATLHSLYYAERQEKGQNRRKEERRH